MVYGRYCISSYLWNGAPPCVKQTQNYANHHFPHTQIEFCGTCSNTPKYVSYYQTVGNIKNYSPNFFVGMFVILGYCQQLLNNGFGCFVIFLNSQSFRGAISSPFPLFSKFNALKSPIFKMLRSQSSTEEIPSGYVNSLRTGKWP
jgi:hypothetical protein